MFWNTAGSRAHPFGRLKELRKRKPRTAQREGKTAAPYG